MLNEQSIREQLVASCQRLYSRNMLAAADGNLSFRLSNERILITPSGRPKAFISPKDIAVINLEGQVLEGSPSGERLMHLEVYRACEKAQTVVHAHPPTAIAWSIARPDMTELPANCLSEVILAAGAIPFAPYARPGTQMMGDVLRPYLPQFRLLVLSRHGALSWGESLEEAVGGMERIEHSAQILKAAHELGGITDLPADEIQFLRELRKTLGDRTL